MLALQTFTNDSIMNLSTLLQATQEDNPDRYALTTMTLSRRGYYSTQLQFIQRDYVATVLENLPEQSVIAPTIINKNIDQVCSQVQILVCGSSVLWCEFSFPNSPFFTESIAGFRYHTLDSICSSIQFLCLIMWG